jgi:succinylglutamic semialdehyde dehydrogenase
MTGDAVLRSVSPADPGDEVGCFPVADGAAVDSAVLRARGATASWRSAGFDARAAVLRRFAALARQRAEEGARLVAREVGKALWDAGAEIALLAAKVEATLDDGLRYVAPIEAGAGARAVFEPRGVLAVIGPFNFPAHLPNGHVVPALATGNTVVLKPSERAPAVGAWMAGLWREAGLPAGVLELVQGPARTGRALALHPGVDGVLFTGSWAAGRALAEATLDQPGKLLALEMGGKNAMVVCADADLELALAEAALSICATTGQRCSSLSRIFVEAPLLDAFAERLARMLAGVRVGPPLDPGTFMGPLVSCAAFERVHRYRALAREAGGQRLAVSAGELPPPFVAPGLVRFPDARQDHPYHREEIFGPEAGLYPVDDLDAAIAAVNDSDYGLAASVVTRDRARFEHCAGRIRTGVLNWNRGTIGASGRLPFGGLRRSGNDRPAGILAAVYCTMPQARLEGPAAFDPASLPPGMPRP